MSFHDIRFPTDISFGSSGGPERPTEIVALNNAFEERNSPWKHARRRYDAGLGARSLDDLSAVVAFFEARGGQLYGFRWKDWTDFTSAQPSATVSMQDQVIGTGDDATTDFQLVKSYASGGVAYLRDITKPVSGSVLVALDGVAQGEGTDFTLDDATGVITMTTAPVLGAVLTAGFEFDVPVRFDTDFIEVSAATFAAGVIPNIPVIEVRG